MPPCQLKPSKTPTPAAPGLIPALAAAALALACASEEVVWPVANSAELDADHVSSPFGPRDQSGRYDFHAGVDFPLADGTKVRAIKAGTVEKVVEWDGSTGPGNWVLVDHGAGEKSAYLHLSKISVKAGAELDAGTRLGRSGSTGSSSPHLHLTYMRGVEGSGADETRALNPLELLPHSPMPEPELEFSGSAVVLTLPLYPMSVERIRVEGEGEARTVDYAEVLALGNPERDDQVQSGLHLALGDAGEGRFTLTLTPEPADFEPDHVLVYDYADELVLDASR